MRKSETGSFRDPERHGREPGDAGETRRSALEAPSPSGFRGLHTRAWVQGLGKLTPPRAPLLSGVSPAGGRLTPPAAADAALSFWVLASPSAGAAEVSSWWEM